MAGLYRPPANVAEHQLRVAMTWVRRGVPVVPCSQAADRAKAAMVGGFRKDSPEEELRKFGDPEWVEWAWTKKYRRAHVGLLTGRGPGRGLVVVDLDPIKPDTILPPDWEGVTHGAEVLERRMPAGAEWPLTYSVATPSGGQHLYFWQPEEGPLIGCATGQGDTPPHVGPLVDVRGFGGYVIAAGSHSTLQGVAYYLSSPASVPVQPLPGWLLEILRPAVAPAAARRPAPVVRTLPTGDRAERAAHGALDHSVRRVQEAQTGERNRALFAAARWLGELAHTAPHVLSAGQVEAELLAPALSVGLTEREALATIRSGWKIGTSGAVGGAA